MVNFTIRIVDIKTTDYSINLFSKASYLLKMIENYWQNNLLSKKSNTTSLKVTRTSFNETKSLYALKAKKLL